MHLQCYPWDQGHQEFQRVREDHEVRGSQEHQQFQEHPVGGNRDLVEHLCWLKEMK